MLKSFVTTLIKPMAVNRRMRRRLILLPCLCAVVFVASYFHDFSADSARLHASSTGPIGFSGTIVEIASTVTVVRTVTEQVRPEATTTPAGLPLQLKSHRFRSDGLLEVDPAGRHPIYDLIDKAEKEWEAKHKRQSRTLDEAVEEYERRYKRAPPKGFDEWWFYCERHDVQLPDEYDRIYHDLEPFWGMSPTDLRRLQAERESHQDSYTIGKSTFDTGIAIVAAQLAPADVPNSPRMAHISQAKEIMDILKEVQDWIPPFRAVFNPHDNPILFTDWELKKQYLDAAKAKKYIDTNQAPPVKYMGWPSACSPTSPLRRASFDLDIPPSPSTEKTFIYDHLKAMDPCLHPSLLHYHGQFLSHNQGPIPHSVMIPQFSYSSTSLHHDILPATPINWVEDIERESDPKFEDKIDDRLLWRGTTTGMWAGGDTRWRNQQRMRLVRLANQLNGTRDVLRSTSSTERVGESVQMSMARVNPAMLDVTFAGEPHSCSEDMCEVVQDEYEFRKYQSVEKAGSYKYILDVDGNGWSSRFKRLMVSNSLIFKSTIFGEWFQERVQPWVHYVPVQVDLSDLYDSLTFFRGGINGDGAHEELAAKIALAGREWAKTYWRKQDMTAYMFRLFLEYSRLMSVDREAASYKESDSSWSRD